MTAIIVISTRFYIKTTVNVEVKVKTMLYNVCRATAFLPCNPTRKSQYIYYYKPHVGLERYSCRIFKTHKIFFKFVLGLLFTIVDQKMEHNYRCGNFMRE